MPRVFVPFVDPDKPVEISGESARYILSVVRMKPGDTLTVVDGEGRRHTVEIWQTIKKESLYAKVLESFPPEPEPKTKIVLLQGILKGQKMDMIVQKATELGVAQIVPLITERTQLRETRKTERWRKIALEAARQCARPDIPEVKEAEEFINVFESSNELKGVMFWEEGGIALKDAFESFSVLPATIYVLIGPEGGFTPEEASIARDKGLIVCTLGRRILRAETAAISALTLVQFMLGEMQ